MSREIDERIVQMQFDNKDFEKKASSTIKVLDKLKQSLNFNNIKAAASNLAGSLGLNKIQDAISTISGRFSNFGIMGVTALQNIANQAIETGKNLVKAFTIDPIKTGFSEYETQINAVQTILANTQSKGTTIDQVNEALDELNVYADKTIYNFSEMTKNIGTFTAAGVNLEDSVAAIKGISNLAAMSGSTSQQAASAMFQLSQAIAGGTVTLQDWNSVMTAGMAGEQFQNALKRTGKLMGANIDESVSFRKSISSEAGSGGTAWLTSDILLETLKQFSGDLSEADLAAKGFNKTEIEDITKLGQTAQDAATKVKTFTQLFSTLKETAQSGWTQTWETVIGDFEEAKGVLTTLNDRLGDLIGKSSDARNAMVSQWEKLGGRKILIDGINESFSTMASIIKPISSAFRELFPKNTAKDLLNNTKNFRDFVKNLKLTDEQALILKESASGLFSVIKMGVDLFHSITDGVKNFFKGLNGPKEVISAISYNLGDMFNGIRYVAEETKFFGRLISSVLTPLKQAFINVFPPKAIGNFDKLHASITGLMSSFKPSYKTLNNLRKIFEGLFSAIAVGIDFIKGLAHVFGILINKIYSSGKISDFIANIADYITEFKDYINEIGGFSKIFDDAIDKIKDVMDKAKEAIGKFIDKLKELFHIDTSNFKKVSSDITEGMSPISKVVSTVSNAFSFLWGIAQKVFSFLQPILQGLLNIIGEIGTAVGNLLSGVDADTVLNSLIKGSLFTAIANLSGFFKGLKDSNKSLKGIATSITDVLGGIKDVLKSFTKEIKSEALLNIAKSIAVLAASSLILSRIDATKLAETTATLVAMFLSLTNSFKSISDASSSLKSAAKLYSIGTLLTKTAVSLLILAAAAKLLSTIDLAKTVTSISALSIMLYALYKTIESFMGIIDNKKSYKNIKVLGKLLKSLASSVIILSIAVKLISTLDWNELAKGLVGVIALLGSVIGFFAATSKIKINPKAVTSLKSIASALIEFSVALKIISSIDPLSLVLALGSFIIVLGATIKAIEKLGNTGITKATVIIPKLVKSLKQMGIAIIELSIAMKIIASMGLAQLGKSLGSIAIILGLFLGSLAIMSKIKGVGKSASSMILMATAILILAPALKLLGSLGWMGLIISISAIAAAFIELGIAAKLLGPKVGTILKLSGAMTLLGAALALAGVGIAAIGTGIAAVGGGVGSFADLINKVFNNILKAIPTFFKKIGEGIVAIINVIKNSTDSIYETIKVLISGALNVINTLAPDIVNTISLLINTVLTTLVEHAGEWAEQLLNILLQVLTALEEYLPDIVQVGIKLFIDTFKAIGSALSETNIEDMKMVLASIGIIASIFLAIKNLGKDMKQAIGPLIMMIVLLAAVVGAFWIVSLIPTETVKVIADGIASALTAITVAMGVAARIPITAAATGLVSLAIFIGGLAAILAILGGLNQIPGFSWLLDEGKKVLVQIGEAIGGFVGAIVGSFLGNVSNGFPKIGQNLSDFFNNAKAFIFGMQKVDGGKLFSAVSSLAGAILEITAADLLNNLLGWLGGNASMADLGNQLVELADPIKKFYNKLDGVDTERLQQAVNSIKIIGDLGNTIKEGGLSSLWEGKTDWSKFTKGIEDLGGGLVKFYQSLLNDNGDFIIELKPIDTAMKAAKMLSDFGTTIKTGGVSGWWSGDTDWDKFSNGISGLGSSLVTFYTSLLDSHGDFIIELKPIDTAMKAAKKLGEFGTTIKSGGVSGWWSGDTDWDKFSKGIDSVGTSLSSFSTNSANINQSNVKVGVDALTSLSDLQSKIADSTSWGNDNPLEKWTNKLGDIGSDISLFYTNLGTVKTSGFSTVAEELRELVDISKSLKDAGDEGNNLYGFSTNLSLIAGDGFNSFKNAIDKSSDGMEDSVKKAYNIVLDGLKGEYRGEKYGGYKHVGSVAILYFGNGINDKKFNVKSTVESIFQEVYDIAAAKTNYYSLGVDSMQGFINGANDNKQRLFETMSKIATDAYDSAAGAVQVASPSKKFEKLGVYIDLGFIKGLIKYASAVNQAGTDLGNGVYNNVKNSIASISAIITDDMDTGPVITPVLDLSEIQNGSSQISNMLDNEYAISSLGKTSYSMGYRRNKYNPNKDIITSINNLGNKFDNLEKSINGITITLDGKTLVGKITPKLNESLGKRIQLSRRGI